MKTFLARLLHGLVHTFFMEVVYAYAFNGRVDIQFIASGAWRDASPELRVCVGPASARRSIIGSLPSKPRP